MQNKFIIGTANFGLKYGIANQKKLPEHTSDKILRNIQEKNLWGIDTAYVYGDSETVVGNYLNHQKPFGIITKLPNQEFSDLSSVLGVFEESLTRLKVKHVDYLLCHSFETYQKNKHLIPEAMGTLMSQGKIKKWGVSVYHPQAVTEVLNDGCQNLVIELPINLLDQRFLNTLESFKAQNCTLLARSVFLQGLFFLDEQAVTERLSIAKKYVLQVQDLATKLGLTVAELALSFIMGIEAIDGIVLGVNTEQQLLELISIANRTFPYQKIIDEVKSLALWDEQIILPQNWTQNHVKN